MSTLLTAPKYFKLKETEAGTVLVNRGVLVKEEVSAKYGNRQFYFKDLEDSNKLKCLSGGQLAFIVDQHNLDANNEVKIIYAGTETIEKGTYKGTQAHQFDVELLNDEQSVLSNQVETNSANELE